MVLAEWSSRNAVAIVTARHGPGYVDGIFPALPTRRVASWTTHQLRRNLACAYRCAVATRGVSQADGHTTHTARTHRVLRALVGRGHDRPKFDWAAAVCVR